MTIVYRYNRESKKMDAVTVEGGNGGNGEYRTWMGIPDDVVKTLLRFAKEDKIDLGSGADTDRAEATAKGKALKLYLMAATREFIAQRDAKAKADAEAEAKAKAEVKVEDKAKAEVAKVAVVVPPVAQPQSNGKSQGKPVAKQTQLVR